MRHRLLIAITLAAVTAVTTATGQTPHTLSGDAAAIYMARTMIERMGGATIWANASALHAIEEAHRDDQALPLRSETWRDLRTPRIWGSTTSSAANRQFAFTSDWGWRADAGVVSTASDMDVAEWRGRWRGNIYVMYHRLARQDAGLRLHVDGERRFSVYDARTSEKLSAFSVNLAGEITRWSMSFGRSSEEWIYGPLADMGAIRMPAWGTRIDGSYRFRYVSVNLTAAPPPISFEPPSKPLISGGF